MITLFNLRPTTPNIGNEVIALALESLLRARLGRDLNLVTLPASGPAGVKGAGLTARNIYEINQLGDGLIIGPGNLFENGALHVDPNALAALTVPTMLFSVSLGRIYGRNGRLVSRTDSLSSEKIEALCQLADPVLVRDRATASHLTWPGLGHVQVGGCPSLLLDEASLPVARPDPAVDGAVLVSVRHPRLMSVPYALQGQIFLYVRRIIDLLRRRGHDRVYLLCHDYQDLSFAQAFPDAETLYTEDAYRFLGWLRDCELNVAFRLHAFLPCIALGTPSVHLSYDERAVSLIDTVGLAQWDVNLVQSEDPLAELERRLDSLSRLGELKRDTRSIRDALAEVMENGIDRFAARLTPRHSNRKFPAFARSIA